MCCSYNYMITLSSTRDYLSRVGRLGFDKNQWRLKGVAQSYVDMVNAASDITAADR